MATIPMTPSRFGHSIQHGDQHYATNSQSMADSLPSVDFGFNDLRERMAVFTARFDEFIERGRKRVLEERNAFRMSVAELEDSKRTRHQAISNLESKSSTHAHTVAKEVQETKELHTTIASLRQQKEDHIRRRADLQAQVNATQAAIKQRRDAQSAYQRSLDAQAQHNIPELRFWEQFLGLRIEGAQAGGERLRFVFSCIDERDEDREAWFEMDLAGNGNRVIETKPRLASEDVQRVETTLSEGRDLGALLKDMRQLFVEAYRR